MAKRFVKLIGLILLTLTWLPSSLIGRHEAGGLALSSQLRERISVETAFDVPDPILATQLHQFRLAGFHISFAKKSGTDFIGAGCSYSGWDSEPVADQLLAFAPYDLFTTWQFSHRTALHPRAPCQV